MTKRIIKLLKYEFRYKISSVYIILGLIIAYITLFNGVGIYQYIMKYTNDLRGNQYAYQSTMIITSLEPFDVRKYLKETMCIVWINYIDVYLNDEDINCLITILVNAGEKTNYHLVEGRLPNEDEIAANEKAVAIGRARKDAVYERDGIKYILIEDEEYRVTGILGTNGSDAQDYLIVTYYDCLGDNALDRIDKYGYELVFESNLSDVSYSCENVSSLARADGLDVSISQRIVNLSRMTLEEKKSLNIYICMFGFAIIGCVMITNFWIFQRKRDIAILRVFGYTRKMVLKKQISELLFHMLCTFIVSGIIQIFLSLFIDLKYNLSLAGILEVMAIFCFLSLLIVINTTVKVMKEPPVYELNGTN